MNRDSRKYKLKVGYTVFVGLIIFSLFIIVVGTEGYYFSKTYNLNLLVKSSEGLIEGGKVTLGGLKIGQISNVRFTTVNNENLVEIKLALLKEYSSHITVNSFAKIETSGLLGDKIINISLGNPSEKSLNEGDYLPVEESLSLESLSSKIEPVINNIEGLTSNLKNISNKLNEENGSAGKIIFGSEITEKLTAILKNLDTFSQSLNNPNNTINKLTHNDELYNDLSSLTSDLKAVVDSIKSGKGTLGKLIANDSFYNNLNNVSMQLNEMLHKTQSDSTVIGGLLNDKKLYKDINDLIEELNKLIVDIKEHPDKYINVSVF